MKLYRYCIYGLVGWCFEILWTGFNSLLAGDVTLKAYTNLWMFFIYGLVLLAEPLFHKIIQLPLIIRGLIYAFSITLVECITGLMLACVIGKCPWYYENGLLVILGVTRMDFLPLWFIVGIIYEKIYIFLIED